MVTSLKPSIPIELMEILHQISNDISDVSKDVTDVRERVIRLEAHNHADAYKTLWNEFEKERDKRIEMQIELSQIKTKLAPIIIGISMGGAAAIELLIRAIH